MQETARFLAELFGDLPDSLWFYIWTLQDKRSHWFQETDDAAKAVGVLDGEDQDGKDCYFGTGLTVEPQGPDRRIKSEDVSGLVGFWADVDYSHPVHKKSEFLPPTMDEAVALVRLAPLKPTVIVHSGHGLQPWWLFKEPWKFEAGDNARAAKLIGGWHRLIKRKAQDRGWTVDTVRDLARVMRVPGTWNHKEHPPIRSSILEADWSSRYTPGDFEQFDVEEIAATKVVSEQYRPGELVLNPSANPPVEKLDTLKENSAEFKKTWEHRRLLPSDSEYEASLARYAAMALWSDQEIADLIIAHRRKWNPDKLPKVTERKDYVSRVIGLVRGEKSRAETILSIAEGTDEAPQMEAAGETADPEQARKSELERLSKIFGIVVEDWIQVGRDKPTYTLVIEGSRQVTIGDVRAVFDSERPFSRAIYAQSGLVMEPVGKKAWPGVCKILSKVCRIIDAPETQESDSVKAAIKAFIKRSDLFRENQKDLACHNEAPFVTDQYLYIHIQGFRRWVRSHWHDQWESTSLLNLMRAVGFAQHTVGYSRPSKERSSRSYWRAPISEFADRISDACQSRFRGEQNKENFDEAPSDSALNG